MLRLQIGKVGHAYQSLSVVSVDALFILVATAFISTGDTFGTQRYGVFPKYPGAFLPELQDHGPVQACSDSLNRSCNTIGHQALHWFVALHCSHYVASCAPASKLCCQI